MLRSLTSLGVFIASPGGLSDERKAFRAEIDEYNEVEAMPRGYMFEPIGWEDTLSAVGRPQAIINEDVSRADYFVLLLWNKWGSPPDATSGKFTSGTEEEYHVALECCQDPKHPLRDVVMMFRSVDPQQLNDPGQELQKVLDFRKKIESEKAHLYDTFDSTERFRKLIRKHLAAWLRSEGPESEDKKAPSPIPPPPVVEQLPSIPHFQEQPTDSGEDSLTARAWQLADEGRITDAEVEFARALIRRRRPEPAIEYGQFLARLGRLAQATALFEEAATIAKDQGNQRALAIACNNMGIALRVKGDLEGAENMFRKALKINERLGRLEGMASSYGNLGLVLRVRGDLNGAEAMHRRALEIEQSLGREEEMASCYGNLGLVLQVRGELDSAEEMHRKALEIEQRLGRPEGIANSYGNLGIVLKTRGDLDGAQYMYRMSLEINEKLGRLEGMASTYGNLGILLKMQGDLDGAEQMYRKSLEINEQLGRPEGMASCYANLGIVLRQRDDLNGAEQMHRKSLDINQKLGSPERMANDYADLGLVLQLRGEFDGAEGMYRMGLEAAQHLGSPQLVKEAQSLLDSLQSLRKAVQDRDKPPGPHPD